ncbi:hypothetical protein B0T17DRAFT_514262 [Bombardia bombarda]|uniref:Secreted protein n=1 Tax=Bombardia bombarda TaxID=252184 RepID=A0AA39XIR8_9PEZI|nr:hypothetical protein B0T17DRAFT_514262 [Bombardia bombarda]
MFVWFLSMISQSPPGTFAALCCCFCLVQSRGQHRVATVFFFFWFLLRGDDAGQLADGCCGVLVLGWVGWAKLDSWC